MGDVFQRIERALSMAKLAARIGVSPQAVWKWKRRNKIPAERVLAVEAATGIPRYEIRPDLYGLEPLQPLSQHAAQSPPRRQFS